MSPWQIVFDAIGWVLIAIVVVGGVTACLTLLRAFALMLWDARGEPPRIYDDATYATFTTNVPCTCRDDDPAGAFCGVHGRLVIAARTPTEESTR